MSGGAFQYKQYYLDDIADELEDIVARGRCVTSYDEYNRAQETYEHYPPDIEQIFLETARKLREARVYVHRADWLLSGDDGEDSFRKRLREELGKLNKGEDV